MPKASFLQRRAMDALWQSAIPILWHGALGILRQNGLGILWQTSEWGNLYDHHAYYHYYYYYYSPTNLLKEGAPIHIKVCGRKSKIRWYQKCSMCLVAIVIHISIYPHTHTHTNTNAQHTHTHLTRVIMDWVHRRYIAFTWISDSFAKN